MWLRVQPMDVTQCRASAVAGLHEFPKGAGSAGSCPSQALIDDLVQLGRNVGIQPHRRCGCPVYDGLEDDSGAVVYNTIMRAIGQREQHGIVKEASGARRARVYLCEEVALDFRRTSTTQASNKSVISVFALETRDI